LPAGTLLGFGCGSIRSLGGFGSGFGSGFGILRIQSIRWSVINSPSIYIIMINLIRAEPECIDIHQKYGDERKDGRYP